MTCYKLQRPDGQFLAYCTGKRALKAWCRAHIVPALPTIDVYEIRPNARPYLVFVVNLHAGGAVITENWRQ